MNAVHKYNTRTPCITIDAVRGRLSRRRPIRVDFFYIVQVFLFVNFADATGLTSVPARLNTVLDAI